IPLPHRVKSPPEQYAVSVRFGIAEGPAVFRVLLRSAPPVGVSWRMAYTMETSRTTIACLLVEYSSNWQNNMATNCPQLLKPRACRSALCLRAAVSNPVREMSCKICEKMLHTLFKAESSSDWLVFSNSTYQRLSAFFFPAALSTAELIWTRMLRDLIADIRERLDGAASQIARFRDYLVYLDSHLPKNMTGEDAQSVVKFHEWGYTSGWENSIARTRTRLETVESSAQTLHHFTTNTIQQLKDCILELEAASKEVNQLTEAISRDLNILKKYVGLVHTARSWMHSTPKEDRSQVQPSPQTRISESGSPQSAANAAPARPTPYFDWALRSLNRPQKFVFALATFGFVMTALRPPFLLGRRVRYGWLWSHSGTRIELTRLLA